MTIEIGTTVKIITVECETFTWNDSKSRIVLHDKNNKLIGDFLYIYFHIKERSR